MKRVKGSIHIIKKIFESLLFMVDAFFQVKGLRLATCLQQTLGSVKRDFYFSQTEYSKNKPHNDFWVHTVCFSTYINQ